MVRQVRFLVTVEEIADAAPARRGRAAAEPTDTPEPATTAAEENQ